MKPITLAVDNGTTGTVAILGGNLTKPIFTAVPVKDCLHYSKAGKMHQRIDVEELKLLFGNVNAAGCEFRAYVERPFTGSAMMINTSILSARAYEATIIALEQCDIGYETIDSREWQKAMLPGVTGRPALKAASKAKGHQLYPLLRATIDTMDDADGLLIAHYYHNRRAHNLE